MGISPTNPGSLNHSKYHIWYRSSPHTMRTPNIFFKALRRAFFNSQKEGQEQLHSNEKTLNRWEWNPGQWADAPAEPYGSAFVKKPLPRAVQLLCSCREGLQFVSVLFCHFQLLLSTTGNHFLERVRLRPAVERSKNLMKKTINSFLNPCTSNLCITCFSFCQKGFANWKSANPKTENNYL